MLPTLMMFALTNGGDDYRSKLAKLLAAQTAGQQTQEFNNMCQTTVDSIQNTEKSAGSITKDNLRTYWDAQLKPDQVAYTLGKCAALKTEDGSELRAKQEQAVATLYKYFIDLHMVVDTHGQPSFFDPSYMQLWDANIPLVVTHQACKPELMFMIEPTINESWLMKGLASISKEMAWQTPLSDFEAQVLADRKAYYTIAKKKTDVCIMDKLKDVKPYAERAPASVRKEWESTVRTAFTDNTDIPIVKIVFTTPEFKRIAETKAEFTPGGDLKVQKQDYDAMDVMVYARNGEYVDGFIVTLYKDRVQNSSYARFYGFDAYGNLKSAHRVLPQNVK